MCICVCVYINMHISNDLELLMAKIAVKYEK